MTSVLGKWVLDSKKGIEDFLRSLSNYFYFHYTIKQYFNYTLLNSIDLVVIRCHIKYFRFQNHHLLSTCRVFCLKKLLTPVPKQEPKAKVGVLCPFQWSVQTRGK